MTSAVSELREKFASVCGHLSLGVSGVLRELGALAGKCESVCNERRGAVAFALQMVFLMHAEDRSERAVAESENCLLVANGLDIIETAVNFVAVDGSDAEAIQIVANLARLTPDHLYPN